MDYRQLAIDETFPFYFAGHLRRSIYAMISSRQQLIYFKA